MLYFSQHMTIKDARLHGLATNRSALDDLVEKSLTRAGLFNEVKDDLYKLSGG